MLIRISLIVAIIGGLAVGGISFFVLQEKITKTITERDKNATDRDTEKGLKVKAERLAKDTQEKLDKTAKELVSAKEERDGAVAKAAEQVKRAEDLAATLKSTEQKLSKTQDDLARWLAFNIPVEKAKEILDSLRATIAERDNVQSENKIIYSKLIQLKSKLDILIGVSTEVTEPEGLSGKVLAVDPKFDFVVLDIGRNHGVLAQGKLLVHHNGKLVAKVRITDDISADRCIANVEPGWKKADITEGDQVFY